MEISHDAQAIMEEVANVYDIKKDPETNNNYYDPRGYLSTNIGKCDLPNDSETEWFMSGDEYVKEFANTVSTKMKNLVGNPTVRKTQ